MTHILQIPLRSDPVHTWAREQPRLLPSSLLPSVTSNRRQWYDTALTAEERENRAGGWVGEGLSLPELKLFLGLCAFTPDAGASLGVGVTTSKKIWGWQIRLQGHALREGRRVRGGAAPQGSPKSPRWLCPARVCPCLWK